jgi:hypothetical protein
MVDKRGILLFALIVFGVLVSINFVSAAVFVFAPGNNSNNSGTFLFNVSYINNTDIVTPINATFYYNLSGTWTVIGNTTPTGGCDLDNQTCGVSLDTTGLTSGYFSINVTIYNATSSVSAATVPHSVLIDNTVPEVSPANFTGPSDDANHSEFISGLVYINVTILDVTSTVQDVFFNISATNGTQNTTVAASREGTTDYFSASLNTTTVPDGSYHIYVHANDSLNNQNNSALVSRVLFDNTAPLAFQANVTTPSVGSNNSEATSNLVTINGSFVDHTSTVMAVFVNITDSTGAQNITVDLTREGTTNTFSATVNTTDYAEDRFNLTFYVNDSSGNTNSNALVNRIAFDNKVPQISPNNISYPASGANFSEITGLVYFNVSIVDVGGGIQAAWLNITNSTSPTQNQTVTLTREGATDWFSASINTSDLAQDKFNITIYTNDSLGFNNNTAFLTAITFDNTVPVISASNITAINAGHNYSEAGLKDSLYINVSFFDALSGVGQVIFNITNGTGVQNGTLTASLTGTNFYATLNTTHFPDGNYTVFALVNDSAGNQNYSASIGTFTLDNTGPVVSHSCTPTSVNTGDPVTCTCSGTDLSGINSTSFTTNPDTSNTGTYSTSCNLIDLAGNSLSADFEYIVEQDGSTAGGGGGGGGGSSRSKWTTYTVNDKKLAEGHKRSLAKNQRLKVSINNEDHFVGVVSISGNSAVIEVSSTPQRATLRVGETKKFEVTGDNYYDISATLNAVSGTRAEVTIRSINELVSVEEPQLQPDVEDAEVNDVDVAPESEVTKDGGIGIWITVIILILLIAGIAWWFIKKR